MPYILYIWILCYVLKFFVTDSTVEEIEHYEYLVNILEGLMT